MSARTEPYTGLKQCAEPNCECTTRVVQAGKKVIVGNVLLRRADCEIWLCLLCYFGYGSTYRGQGWEVVETNRLTID